MLQVRGEETHINRKGREVALSCCPNDHMYDTSLEQLRRQEDRVLFFSARVCVRLVIVKQKYKLWVILARVPGFYGVTYPWYGRPRQKVDSAKVVSPRSGALGSIRVPTLVPNLQYR